MIKRNMRLKSLEIHGFKSFADKSVLTFFPPKQDRNSVTAIVGPNGSGKSNIVDALRWVMGEQSMRALRGKKGPDVIFSGSHSKGKMGIATVTMTLDNNDHRMPIPYDEIVISRRADQSGNSEYIVNGNPVRLFDLQVLLAQAQFGHGSYSVIGQGMIDRLLAHTPSERKEFFDEACGIKEFQIKRHQAALKLERTSQHIGEAELLLNELSPRLKTLSRQVKKLEERQDTELKLRESQEIYYVTLWGGIRESLKTLRQDRAVIEDAVEKDQAQMRVLQEDLRNFSLDNSSEKQVRDLEKECDNIIEEKQQVIREETTLQAKLQTEYGSAGKQDAGWMVSRIDGMKAEVARLSIALKSAEQSDNEAKAKLNEIESERARVIEKRDNLRALLNREDDELSRMKNETSALSGVETRAVGAVLGGADDQGSVHGILSDLGKPKNSIYSLALDVAAGSFLSAIVVADDRVAERWIRRLRESQIGIATFLPLNTVKPRILPSDIDSLLKREGVHGLAIDFLDFDKKFLSVFSFVLGGALIVESIDSARGAGIGRMRMVTLAGDVIETNGSMKGGFRARRSNGSSFSSHQGGARLSGFISEKEKEIAVLKDDLLAAEKRLEELDSNMRDLYRDAETANARRVSLERNVRANENDLKTLEDDYALSNSDPKIVGVLIAQMRVRYDALVLRAKELDGSLSEKHAAIEHLRKEDEEKKKRAFSTQGNLQDIQTSLGSKLEDAHRKQIEITRLETKEEDIAEEAERELKEPISSIAARGISSVRADETEEIFQKIQKFKYALTLIGGIDEEVMNEYKDTLGRHTGLSEQLGDLNRAMEDLKKLVAELDDIMKKKRAEMFRGIKKEFSRYFSMFFGGGKADLVEVYQDEDSEDQYAEGSEEEKPKKARAQSLAGIDVIANPPGKKITNIQALSGGERTMTSLALLSAILHTNPAPFVLLDEVEASLDEANTVRFGQIIQELASQSQFILITHNRATMHIADALYGVTMGGDGISRLLSVSVAE